MLQEHKEFSLTRDELVGISYVDVLARIQASAASASSAHEQLLSELIPTAKKMRRTLTCRYRRHTHHTAFEYEINIAPTEGNGRMPPFMTVLFEQHSPVSLKKPRAFAPHGMDRLNRCTQDVAQRYDNPSALLATDMVRRLANKHGHQYTLHCITDDPECQVAYLTCPRTHTSMEFSFYA